MPSSYSIENLKDVFDDEEVTTSILNIKELSCIIKKLRELSLSLPKGNKLSILQKIILNLSEEER